MKSFKSRLLKNISPNRSSSKAFWRHYDARIPEISGIVIGSLVVAILALWNYSK